MLCFTTVIVYCYISVTANMLNCEVYNCVVKHGYKDAYLWSNWLIEPHDLKYKHI